MDDKLFIFIYRVANNNHYYPRFFYISPLFLLMLCIAQHKLM